MIRKGKPEKSAYCFAILQMLNIVNFIIAVFYHEKIAMILIGLVFGLFILSYFFSTDLYYVIPFPHLVNTEIRGIPERVNISSIQMNHHETLNALFKYKLVMYATRTRYYPRLIKVKKNNPVFPPDVVAVSSMFGSSNMDGNLESQNNSSENPSNSPTSQSGQIF